VKYFLLLLCSIIACQTPSNEKKIQQDLGFIFKPNILWLSTEDIGCFIPAYGDSTINTPHLDRLAAEGVVFENAFTTAGQCAPSRFSIISGIHPASTGASHMRTRGRRLPDSIRYFTQFLMDDGFYCTNNSKTDYNFSELRHDLLWDETSKDAHYQNRPAGQPFFAVFNFVETHESRFFDNPKLLTVTPKEVPVPPYYPDDEVIRKDLARNYANIKLLDEWVGGHLKALEDEGLLDSTIVFFWSDHGGPLPNQKREIYDRGTRVPLMIRFPNQINAGSRIGEMVSLMDLGPTVMSLAGLSTPKYMQGQAFLGRYKASPRRYIHSSRDRIAAQYDMRRTVRSQRYRYVRNYYPELPRYQHFNYRMNIDMMMEILRLEKHDQLSDPQKRWFEAFKPVEEFYDMQYDPHEMNNLIDNPEYAEEINQLRNAHQSWIVENKDVGLIPEPMIFKLQDSLGMPIYSIVRQSNYPFEKIRKVATLWTEAGNLEELVNYVHDTLPVIRYWAVTGLGNSGEPAKVFREDIYSLLEDEFVSVQIAAAYALHQLEDTETAIEKLSEVLTNDQIFARILAAFQLARIGPPAITTEAQLEKLLKGESYEMQAAENALKAIRNNGNN